MKTHRPEPTSTEIIAAINSLISLSTGMSGKLIEPIKPVAIRCVTKLPSAMEPKASKMVATMSVLRNESAFEPNVADIEFATSLAPIEKDIAKPHTIERPKSMGIDNITMAMLQSVCNVTQVFFFLSQRKFFLLQSLPI